MPPKVARPAQLSRPFQIGSDGVRPRWALNDAFVLVQRVPCRALSALRPALLDLTRVAVGVVARTSGGIVTVHSFAVACKGLVADPHSLPQPEADLAATALGYTKSILEIEPGATCDAAFHKVAESTGSAACVAA